jgi:hypothetical protein
MCVSHGFDQLTMTKAPLRVVLLWQITMTTTMTREEQAQQAGAKKLSRLDGEKRQKM